MRTVERSIRSVLPIARRVVVVDSRSTDGTQDACRALGAEVHEHPWDGFGPQVERASALAGDVAWILRLDADEIVSDELLDGIRRVVAADDRSIDAYWIARRYWYKGRALRVAYPDRVLRLFRRGRAAMSSTGSPHDALQASGPTGRLGGVLRHESWSSLDDALTRNLGYARQMSRIGRRRGSMARVLVNAPWAFLRAYVLQRGFLDGRRGVEIALVLATSTAFKHLLRIEAQRDAGSAVHDA